MNTKQIKERINRMMQEERVTPDQAVELMASVMSLIEVRVLADDLTAAVVDKALAEIGEGKLAVGKAVELFDELRAMAEKEEAAKSAQAKEERSKKNFTGEELGGMFRDVTGEALEYARDQIEIAREKLDKQGERVRRRMKEKGIGRIDGDVVQDHYTASACSTITGDLKTKTTVVHGALSLEGDLQAKESLTISGKLDCRGDIVSGQTDIHGTGSCGGDLKTGDLTVMGRMHCGGDLKSGEISIRGAVDCAGDMAGEDIGISGRCKSGGDVQGREVQVSGGLDCAGDLRADQIHGSGSIRCGGDLNAKKLTVSGKTECGGDVCVKDTIKVSGKLHSGGDMEAADIHMSGKITCGGDLKGGAAYVSGRLLGDGDMVFETLAVEEPREWVEWLTGGLIKDVDQVECKGDLTVKGEVRARGRVVVMGKASFARGTIEYLSAGRVSLGPGVKAKRVEYRDELVLAEGAEVEESVQV